MALKQNPVVRRWGRGVSALAAVLAVALPAVSASAAPAGTGVGSTTPVSVTLAGVPVTAGDPTLSADGRYVAFASAAPGLAAGDNNGISDVFRRDLLTGVTVRVSVAMPGTRLYSGRVGSSEPAISADGQVVAFVSDAEHLVPGVRAGQPHLYARDLLTGTTQLLDLDADGQPALTDHWNWPSTPSLSADGRYVAYVTPASGGVTLRDLSTGTAQRVSEPGCFDDAYGSQPTLSADGSTVAWVSEGNCYGGRFNYKEQIWLRDLRTGALELVSTAPGGAGGNAGSYDPSLSADGNEVSWSTRATNLHLGPGTTNGYPAVVVKDRATAKTSLVSATPAGLASVGFPGASRLTPDGTAVLFASDSDQLVPGMPGQQLTQIYQRDLATGVTRLVSVDNAGRPVDGVTPSGGTPMSADGSLVVFESAGLPVNGHLQLPVFVHRED